MPGIARHPPSRLAPMSPLSEAEALRRARHRRRIVFGLAVVLAVFVAVEAILQQMADTALPVSNTVLLHAITVVNIVLVLVLLFVLGRNLIKLYVDRRHGRLGSRFQTKLMVTYVGLSLVPTIVLFLVASDFIQKSVDRWFSKDVTEVHERARDLVRRAMETQELQLLETARLIGRQITDGRIIQNRAWKVLERDMRRTLAQEHLDLDAVALYRGDRVLLAPLVREGSFLQEREHLLQIPPGSILLGMSGQPFRLRQSTEGRNVLVHAGVPVFQPGGREVAAVLVLTRVVDGALAAEVSAIEQLYSNYSQGIEEKGPITNAYLLTFLLLSLLIIFSAVWLGLYLARGVTVPIQRLSEGTRAVAAGNLSYRVDVQTNDELGVLVASFNRMTEDLQASQRSLEQSRADLERSIAELEERRSYMESVLANIATGVVSMNADGRITTCNPAAAEMLAVDAGAIIGRPIEEVFAGEHLEPLRTLMHHARPRLGQLEQELTIDVGGQRLTLAAYCSSLRDKSGAYLGTVVVLDDLTGLIRAQKAAAWREVARRIAHEIRNPLTPIQLSAQRIARRYRRVAGAEAEYAVIEEGTRTILQEVAALKSLVEEFSRFARMPSANPVAADLHQILEDSLRPYVQLYPAVEIVRRFGADVPSLELDPAQMRRAFTNLFDNAVKAMQEQGRLSVSTGFDPELQVVRVEIADTGPGIRAEDKERLFVPYFSRKRGGTGLGLAIVRQIIADHRGYIRVVDNVPRGATFVIELPVQ